MGSGRGQREETSDESDEEEAPSPTRRGEVQLPRVRRTPWLATAAEEQAADARRQAESGAAAELQRAETVRAARLEAAARSRKRLGGRRVHLQAVVFSYARKYGLTAGATHCRGTGCSPTKEMCATRLRSGNRWMRLCASARWRRVFGHEPGAQNPPPKTMYVQ